MAPSQMSLCISSIGWSMNMHGNRRSQATSPVGRPSIIWAKVKSASSVARMLAIARVRISRWSPGGRSVKGMRWECALRAAMRIFSVWMMMSSGSMMKGS